MASTFTAGVEGDSDSGFGEFAEEDHSSEDEGDNWVNNEYFKAEDVQAKIKDCCPVTFTIVEGGLNTIVQFNRINTTK